MSPAMGKHKIGPSPPYTTIPMYTETPTKTKDKVTTQPQRRHYSYPITFRQHLFSSKSILARLVSSFLPPIGPFKQTPLDYEGTALSIFLLSAVLFSRTTTTGRNLSWLLLPLALPTLYVTITTTLIFLISRLTKTNVTFRELFCLLGYGLFGSTLTLLLTQISDRLFFPSLIMLTGLNSVRITLTLFFKTRVPALRFILGTPTAIIHVLFPIYLYYATKTN